MQDNFSQTQSQPFFKLVQANMDLISKFATSPEVTSQATVNANQFFQQATESTTKLMQSGAFAQLTQGMLKNYTEFMMELSQSGMAMMSQAQAAVTRQVAEHTTEANEASELRSRRPRQVA